MAVRGREMINGRKMGVVNMALVAIVIIGYNLLYYNWIVKIPESNFRTAMIVVATVVVLAVLGWVLIQMMIKTFLLLTHDTLTIETKMLWRTKTVASVKIASMESIVPIQQKPEIDGKVDSTAAMDVRGKQKYFLSYKEGDVTNALVLQCSNVFYDKIYDEIERVKQVGQPAQAKKKKKKK